MRRWLLRTLPLVAAGGMMGCEDELPTGVDEGLFPLDPVTVEVLLPWSEFATDLRVLGGFGTPNELGVGVLADDFEGSLDARTLVRLAAFPASASVRDSLGTTRVDEDLTFVGGTLVVKLDTLASTAQGPVTLTAGRTLTEWHAGSATWELAVDTFGVTVPWPEEGGGPVDPLGSVSWDPAAGDSAVFELDSAMVAAIGDSASSRELRLTVETGGERLEVGLIRLLLDTRPSIHQDTLVTLVSSASAVTFIYQPTPAPPPDGIRVGGVPAWRSVLTLDLPESVTASPEVCARVGCPITLTPERINSAELVLATRREHPAFLPVDTLRLDVRTVLAPEVLPKSPLGPAFIFTGGLSTGVPVAPAAFASEGQRVQFPLTPVVRDLVRGETEAGLDPPGTVALLSLAEPLSIAFGSFFGPGSEQEPHLRLVLTISDRVELP